MSERELRRRIPVSRIARSGASQRPSQSPSPSGHRRSKPVPVPVRRRSSKKSLIRTLKRCGSEPALWPVGNSAPEDDGWNLTPPQQEVLFRPQTCTDIFSSRDYFVNVSPAKLANNSPGHYNKDCKVVVNVTVDGSPGPVRTMVKLGTSVEETIHLAVNKYNEEGRSPHLDINGVSSFELYNSYFSLQSLSKSEVIGDVGSRSFYLRKSNKDVISVNSGDMLPPPPLVSPSEFFSRKFKKLLRRSQKLFNFLGCLQ